MPVRFKGAFFLSLELSRMCTAIAPSPTLAIDAKAKEMRLNGRDVVSFSVGEPGFRYAAVYPYGGAMRLWIWG